MCYSGFRVLGFLECAGRISRHLDVQQVGAVIIFESYASVDSYCTVLVDLIISLEGCIEVVGILLLGVFYSKIIYH